MQIFSDSGFFQLVMEKTKTINSTQIAKLAGVSRSTVSKVINNYPDSPEETKNKVRAIIAEHRYTPNIIPGGFSGKYGAQAAKQILSQAQCPRPWFVPVMPRRMV